MVSFPVVLVAQSLKKRYVKATQANSNFWEFPIALSNKEPPKN